MLDSPGEPDVITEVLVRGSRGQGQGGGCEEGSRGRSDVATSQAMWAAAGSRSR